MRSAEDVRRRIPITAPTHGRAEAEAAYRVVLSGLLSEGAEVRALEDELADNLGVADAVVVSNGTTALELALRALGIGRGDEVVTTPFSFFATASAILNVGARPVFADVDPATHNLDPEAAAAAIGPSTAAILPVHLYGRPCDMDAFAGLARRHGLALVEDACQALGARYRGRAAGSFGVGCFSFYGSKNLSCGEGGAIAVRDARLAERLRMLRNHGSVRRYVHERVSSNHRLTDLQAAVLRVQLARLKEITAARQEVAARYDELLSCAAVRLPMANDDVYESCYHLYTVGVSRGRERVMASLDAAGIEARVHYPAPIYRQPAWPGASLPLPNAERGAREVLSIPLFPGLSPDDVRYVASVLTAAVERTA